MIEIKQSLLTDDVVKELIDLSSTWVEEDICFGIVKNSKEDLKEPLFIALDNNKIVGYIFGHFYDEEEKRSYISIGSKCFMVDEIYVLKEYRNQKIGKRLYEKMEAFVKDKCQYITLATSNKDYKKILKFYVEDLKLTFHSAFLIKNLQDDD